MNRLITLLILGVFSFNFVNAQYNYDEIKSSVFSYIGTGNMGTEFMFGIHPGMNDDKQISRVKIFITSKVQTEVRLTVPGISNTPLKTKMTIPDELIELTLEPGEAQPYIRGQGGAKSKIEPTKVWQGRAVILQSDEPIIAYVSVQYENATDGFLAIPTHLMDKEYIISSYRETSSNENNEFTSYTSIVGIYDKTNVNFAFGGNPSANNEIKTQDNKFWKPYDIIRADLNRGDVWLVAAINSSSDLGGSYVSATKPIAVYSGTYYSHIPNDDQSGDYLIEQEIGMNYWGNKYYVTPIFTRTMSSTIRVFTANSDYGIFTNYSTDSLKLEENWGLQNKAWSELAAVPNSNSPAVYWSSTPINLMQYNRGSDGGTTLAKPFQMQVLSDMNFQKEIYLFVPGTPAQSFKDNYINLIYRAKNGNIPSDLQIGFSEKGKPYVWKKVNELAEADLGMMIPDPEHSNPDNAYYSKTIRITNPGVYRIINSEPIAAYLYGFGANQGYGSIASYNYSEETIVNQPKLNIVISPGQVIDSVLISLNPERNGVLQMDNNCLECIRYAYFHKGISYNSEITLEKAQYPATKVNYVFKVTNLTKNALAAITAVDVWGNKKTAVIRYIPSIDYSKSISVTKPKYGEMYNYGDAITLNWSSNFSENVKIELYKGDEYVLTFWDNYPNTGTYIPQIDIKVVPPGKDYRIKVSSLEEPNVYAFSGYFELTDKVLKQLTLLLPNQKESHKKGETISIVYQRNSPFPVDIWVYQFGNKIFQIASNYDFSFKEWIIPEDFPIGEKYVFRISSTEEQDVFAESPEFSILPNEGEITLKVISPKAGEIYETGQKLNIKCETNYNGKFKIELMKGDQRIKIINFSAENIDNFEWTITNDISEGLNYRIKVSETIYTNVVAYSDTFAITPKVSIRNGFESKFNIVPNPTNGLIYLDDNEEFTEVSIFDIFGRELFRTENTERINNVLNLANLENGTYLLIIKHGNKVIAAKQVILIK